MNKVCSLDFLNNDFFEADIKTANGTVLFKTGDAITPEVILKLYFKNIYVEELVELQAPLREQKSDDEPVELNPSSRDYNNRSGDVATNNVIDGVLGIKKEDEQSEASSDGEFVQVSDEAEKEMDIALEDLQAETAEIEVMSASFGGINPTPQMSAPKKSVKRISPEDDAFDPTKPDPNDLPMEFDEDEAQRIVSHSLAIGKMLNYSAKDLKELEQVAYNCNIGIINFRKSEIKQKGFRKKKAFASYNELVRQDMVSGDVAEAVKYCANRYESEAFPLNSKIPYHHIVSVSSYYEEALTQGKSKSATLLEMLQQGGHRFNIFVLHKFIKMMRDADG